MGSAEMVNGNTGRPGDLLRGGLGSRDPGAACTSSCASQGHRCSTELTARSKTKARPRKSNRAVQSDAGGWPGDV